MYWWQAAFLWNQYQTNCGWLNCVITPFACLTWLPPQQDETLLNSGDRFHLILSSRTVARHKCYICLFTCSTTRNVNLEIVNHMSTDQFLHAFRRHCAIYRTPCVTMPSICERWWRNSEVVSSHRRSESAASFHSEKSLSHTHSSQVATLGWYVRTSDWSC